MKEKEMSAEKAEQMEMPIQNKANQKPRLSNIKLEKLHSFQNHPYKVLDDDSMEELKESIQESGLLNRIMVRPLENSNDEYEIISGHRRVHAAELLKLKEVPAVIYFANRDEATKLMVDSNIQRENVSIMEKGRAYRMKLEAIKHQGKTSCHNGTKLRSDEIIAESTNDSARQIQRYIRLTYLTPELQEYVDTGKMKLLPAVEISYLDEESQRDIVDRIIETETFPSHAQARKMRAIFDEGKLDYNAVTEIMNELKPNQVEKLKIPMDSIRKYAPKNASPKDIENLVIKLMKQNYDRQHSRDAR